MNNNFITLLHPNDVIFGRGPIPNSYEGNRRFRELIRRHRTSYTSGNRVEKQKLGYDILVQIHATGGRFLKHVDPMLAVDAYYEVSVKVALAKIKQALREHRNDPWWLDGGASSESHAKESNPKRIYHKKGKSRRLPLARKQEDNLDTKPKKLQSDGDAPPFDFLLGATWLVEGTTSESHAKESTPKRSYHKRGKARRLPLARKQVDNLGTKPKELQSDGNAPPLKSLMGTTSAKASFPKTPTRISPSADGSLMSAVITPPRVAENTSFPSMVLPPLVPIEAIDKKGVSTFDTRLLLFQDQMLVPQQQAITSRSFATIASPPSAMVPFSSSWDVSSAPGKGFATRNVQGKRKNAIENESIDSLFQDFSLSQSRDMSETAVANSTYSSAFNETPELTEKKHLTGGPSEDMSEEDVAAFLLSSLALADRPIVTEEDEALERALLTTAERAVVLSDALGIPSKRNAPHVDKRQRTNLDRKTKAFLVGLMKTEIEKIPPKHRRALIEAQMNCGVDEFSDSRLEEFLKAEGMNANMAALRFVRYWESRKEIFGNEKYLEKMELRGALRDDLAALQSGVFCLLEPDASGRYILFANVAKHSLDDYTSDSLLRAVWYLVELAARDENNTGIVQVVWFQGATIWDYDLHVYDRLAYMMSNCFPIQFKANHLCCLPRIAACLIKPIIHSFMSKDMRIHTIQHDVPADEIIEVLSNYGLHHNMLPTVMGGGVSLDLEEFVAKRFAIEAEEL